MPGAYVLINTEVGSEEVVLAEIKKLSAVKDAHIVYGIYDLVVRLEEADMTKLKEEITEHIRKIELVRSTLTMILIE